MTYWSVEQSAPRIARVIQTSGRCFLWVRRSAICPTSAIVWIEGVAKYITICQEC